MHARRNLCTLRRKYARSAQFMHVQKKIRTFNPTYARSTKFPAKKSLSLVYERDHTTFIQILALCVFSSPVRRNKRVRSILLRCMQVR